MANTLLTSNIVAKECLAILKNTCTFAKGVNRSWEDEFKSNMARGYESGSTITIRKPPRFTYRAGRVAVPQAVTFGSTSLTLNQGGCDIPLTSVERTLSISHPNVQKTIQSAMAAVVNEIDRQGLDLVRTSVGNLSSVNATTMVQPATQAEALAMFTTAGRILDDEAAPRDGRRNVVLSSGLNAASVQGLAGLFNDSRLIGKQYGTGLVVDSLGFNVGMDQNTARHANGAATATNVNGANQTGSAITVVAVAGGTLAKGTVITWPNVYAVNPQSRQSTGRLREFVVTADAAAGATTLNISPPIVTSGPNQNCSASPTTGSPYVIKGSANVSYDCSVAFHEDAFTLAMAPMWSPSGLGPKVSQISEDGFTVKVTEYYDGGNDMSNMRLDVLFGWAATYPELAVRMATTG